MFLDEIWAFHTAYEELIVDEQISSSIRPPAKSDLIAFDQQRSAAAVATRERLRTKLSPVAFTKLVKKIQFEKQRMHIIPFPEMSSNHH